MDEMGFVAIILLMWLVWGPESLGHQIGRVIHAIEATR